MGTKIVYDILHLDGTRLLLSVKDNTQNSISVLVIEPINKSSIWAYTFSNRCVHPSTDSLS
jgi:hypothetical protein